MGNSNRGVTNYPGEQSSLVERMKWLIEHCKDNQVNGIRFNNDIIEAAGLSSSYISDLNSGRVKNPSADAVAGISEATGARLGWLMYGKGRPFMDEPGALEDYQTQQARDLHKRIVKYLTERNASSDSNPPNPLLLAFRDQLKSQLAQNQSQVDQIQSMLQILDHLTAPAADQDEHE